MTRRERLILAAIKLTHTLVFLSNAMAIGFALWAALAGVITPMVWAALALPAVTWLGIQANGDECILQTWSKRLHGTDEWVSDIYIPDWIAVRVRPVLTPLYAMSAVLVGLRLI